MPGTNEILRFCQNDTTTNLLTQGEYSADSQRLIGNQPGNARSKLVNKVLRQTSLMSSGLAEWIAALQNDNVTDGLTPAQIQARMNAAFEAKFAAMLAAAQVVLPGSIMFWPTSTPPSGWLKRNGAAISRTTYAALFSVIGTTYGAGDGSTTFNLPDDRALFLRGWDDSRGIDVARVFGSEQTSQNQSHTHTASTNTAGDHAHSYTGGIVGLGYNTGAAANGTGTSSTSTAGAHSHTVTVNSSGGSEARPINRAYLPIIKF